MEEKEAALQTLLSCWQEAEGYLEKKRGQLDHDGAKLKHIELLPRRHEVV